MKYETCYQKLGILIMSLCLAAAEPVVTVSADTDSLLSVTDEAQIKPM